MPIIFPSSSHPFFLLSKYDPLFFFFPPANLFPNKVFNNSAYLPNEHVGRGGEGGWWYQYQPEPLVMKMWTSKRQNPPRCLWPQATFLLKLLLNHSAWSMWLTMYAFPRRVTYHHYHQPLILMELLFTKRQHPFFYYIYLVAYDGFKPFNIGR